MVEKRWVTGRELLTIWDIDEATLFECLRKGLTAYTRSGKVLTDELSVSWVDLPIDELKRRYPAPDEITAGCEYEYEQDERLRLYYKKIRKKYGKVPSQPEGCYVVPFTLPDDQEEANRLLDEAMENWRFYLHIVKWFIDDHPEYPPLEIPTAGDSKSHEIEDERTGAEDARFHEFLLMAGNEAERLFAYVEHELKLFGKGDETSEWYNTAKSHFEQHRQEWTLLKKEHIDDAKVFRTIPGDQNRRDFVGKVLQRILIDNGHGVHQAQKLYSTYNALKRGKLK